MSDPQTVSKAKSLKHQEGTDYVCTSATNAFQGYKYGKRQKNTFLRQCLIPSFYCQTHDGKCQSREYNKELIATIDSVNDLP